MRKPEAFPDFGGVQMLIEKFGCVPFPGIVLAVLLCSCGDPAPPTAPVSTPTSAQPSDPWPRINPAPLNSEVEAFVADLLARMTLEEKVGQVIQAERSEEHTSELQSRENLVCRLLLEKKNMKATL